MKEETMYPCGLITKDGKLKQCSGIWNVGTNTRSVMCTPLPVHGMRCRFAAKLPFSFDEVEVEP